MFCFDTVNCPLTFQAFKCFEIPDAHRLILYWAHTLQILGATLKCVWKWSRSGTFFWVHTLPGWKMIKCWSRLLCWAETRVPAAVPGGGHSIKGYLPRTLLPTFPIDSPPFSHFLPHPRPHYPASAKPIGLPGSLLSPSLMLW